MQTQQQSKEFSNLRRAAELIRVPEPGTLNYEQERWAKLKVFQKMSAEQRKRFVFAGPSGSASPWYQIKNEVKSEAAEISIYEQIGKDWWSGDGVEGKKFAEDLKEIPKSREILVRINSPGGSVHDGLLIYNLLAERRDKVTCQIDGIALSAASFIAMAAKTVRMPKNALLMIHDPWSVAMGNAEEMRKAADMLDKHRDSIASIYERKSQAPMDDIKAWMAAESWYTGEEAKEAGFCDEVTDEISLQACFDFGRFKRVPEQLQKNAKAHKGTENMNRAEMTARLEQLGVEFEDSQTDEELQALLAESEKKAKAKADKEKKAKAAKAKARAEQEAETEVETEIELEEEINPRAGSLGTKARTNPEIENRLKAMEAKYAAQRKATVAAEVQKCVDDFRIPVAQADEWIDDILNAPSEAQGEKILNRLKAMESRTPGHESVGIVVVSEDPQAVGKGIMQLRQPIESWRRGNDVDPKVISDRAMKIAATLDRQRNPKTGLFDRLMPILNANTVDPNLKRTVILSDVMRAFKRNLIMLSVFSTKYENVPLQGTNKVAVAFYELETGASTNFDASNGYVFSSDTSVGSREVTINKRKYQTMDFSSDTFSRQPYFRPEVHLNMKAEKLALDVWEDVLSVVTDSNFNNVAITEEAGNFDSDDMALLKKKATDADWPDIGRSCVIGTDRELGLNQDDAIKHWQNSGSTDSLREGSVGRLSGFDVVISPRIPTNSQDLGGFICLPQAAIVATAPIMPARGVRQQLLAYDIVIDPQTGIAFEYRHGADVWMDKDREVVECNYGFGKGNGNALQRILNGATEFSSSSSASSVNSSSSSSSSPSF